MGDVKRVAIDARYWRAGIQTGVERYIHLLLEALAATGPDAPQVGLVLRSSEADAFPTDWYPSLELTVRPVTDRRESTLHQALLHLCPAVAHFPFELPPRLRVPSVFTLHDAGRYLFPEQMVKTVRESQNQRFKRLLDDPLLRAVITVSYASRTDITSCLGALPKPLLVVPNFVSQSFAQQLHPRMDEAAPSERFLLAVGVYMPSKNIPRLCRAFRAARRKAPDVVPPRLLLAGRRGWERGLPARTDESITVLGHVDDQRLAALYRTAHAIVFPTLFEGFGIPAQEALAAERRLLCSDLPVLREVTMNLAQYVNPHDEDALADGIVRISTGEPPAPTGVRSLLDSYSARSIGPRLLDAYGRALSSA